MVIDCFPYFNEKQILELRINILNDYVDKFLIFDANYTHSGIPKPFTCKQTISDLGLVSDKIEVIELDLSDENLPVSDEYDKLWNSDAILGSRERLQRDGILSVLDNFNDNDVFIVSDCDEIINPINIEFLSDILKYQYNSVIKVPLILLEGRADLRTYYSNSSVEKPWNKSMYMCLKHHLQKCFPTQIRAEYNLPFGVTYATQNNQVLTDLGWHFTWMGDTVNRIIKAKSFCHYSNNLVESMKYYEPKEGAISPESIYFSNENYVLRKYPIENLPQIIFELPRVKQFLLP